MSDEGDAQDEEAILYSGLHEPQRDWRYLDTVRQVAEELGLNLPSGMLDAVRMDQISNAGNRMVVHHFDQPPELLLAD